jgi:hypothetical protein
MNVDPDQTGKVYWGRMGWATIHTLASCADNADKITRKYFLMWMNKLVPLLPCKQVCSVHLKQNLEQYPFQDNTAVNIENSGSNKNNTLLSWTYELHDKVNREASKRSPALDVVQTFYKPSRAGNPKVYMPYLFGFLLSIAYDYNFDIRDDLIRFVALTGLILPDKETRAKWTEFTNVYEIKLYMHNKDDLFYYFYMLRRYLDPKYIESISRESKSYVTKFNPESATCSTCGK